MYFRRLKNLREDRDLKQENIATMLKITRQQYGLYETGKRTIPIDLLISLSLFYDVSIDYMVGITDNKKRFYKE